MSDLIKAIRDNDRIGAGSCSVVDECYSNEEIAIVLEEQGITEPQDAIDWALDVEGLAKESALNARWGEDDDPALLDWQDWNDDDLAPCSTGGP